jgi:hypothetical protein
MAQVVECLSSKQQAVSLNPSAIKKKKKNKKPNQTKIKKKKKLYLKTRVEVRGM